MRASRLAPRLAGLRKHTTAVWLGLFAASLFLLLQQGAVINSDGASVYALTRSLVEDGDLSVEREVGVAGRNGEYYSKYGIGLSLLAVVPYALVRPLAELYERPDAVEQVAVATLLPLVSALLLVALFALCRRLGAGVRSSVLVALGAVAGTFLLVYTKEFFGEPVVALFLVIALERALAGRSGQSGAALAAGALVRPEAFVFAPGPRAVSGAHTRPLGGHPIRHSATRCPGLHACVQHLSIRRRAANRLRRQ